MIAPLMPRHTKSKKNPMVAPNVLNMTVLIVPTVSTAVKKATEQ